MMQATYSLKQGSLRANFGCARQDDGVPKFTCHTSQSTNENYRITQTREGTQVEEYSCVLAEAAAIGNVQEVQWLMAHTPIGYSAQLLQGGRIALFAAVFGGHHAVCQLLLEWLNPNKDPMELPMCSYRWSSNTGGHSGQAEVSFLGLAYEWRKIQHKQWQASVGHYREYTGRFVPSWQYLGLLQLLLEYRPSLSLGAQGLFQAIAYSADVGAIQLLLKHGLDANAALSDGNTLLHLLVRLNRRERYEPEIIQDRGTQIGAAVRTLLEAGASPLARNNTQKTPLDECFPGFSIIKALMQDALQPRAACVAGQHHITSAGLHAAFAWIVHQSWYWYLAGICVFAMTALVMRNSDVPYVAHLLLR